MIVNTVTNDYEFYEWLQNSDNYKDKFTLEGAKQLQQYYDELSDHLDEPIEFDPIAWLCEFSEYKDFQEFQNDSGYIKDGKQYKGYDNINSLDDLCDRTEVVKFDGGILVGNF
jgi:hypothetical protein